MKCDPIECSLSCAVYMFCIGLMMAELRPKHLAVLVCKGKKTGMKLMGGRRNTKEGGE